MFTGPNGTGKTNLLESIYFLSILRSFRSASGRELTRIGSRGFELSARVHSRGYPETLKVIQHGNRRETLIGAAGFVAQANSSGNSAPLFSCRKTGISPAEVRHFAVVFSIC